MEHADALVGDGAGEEPPEKARIKGLDVVGAGAVGGGGAVKESAAAASGVSGGGCCGGVLNSREGGWEAVGGRVVPAGQGRMDGDGWVEGLGGWRGWVGGGAGWVRGGRGGGVVPVHLVAREAAEEEELSTP